MSPAASVDCVIPANNEASTIAAVAKACVAAQVFRRVLVVDDGSHDWTWYVAGVDVLRVDPNGGKAEAMLSGVRILDTLDNDFAFFDADLVGFGPEHVRLLAAHFAQGYDMVCGLEDQGWRNVTQLVAPLLSGQRFIRRWILEELPSSCWMAGYGIEEALNFTADKGNGRTCLVPLTGVHGRTKRDKVGFFKGWRNHIKMLRHTAETKRNLERTGGMSCAKATKP